MKQLLLIALFISSCFSCFAQDHVKLITGLSRSLTKEILSKHGSDLFYSELDVNLGVCFEKQWGSISLIGGYKYATD